MRGQFVGVAFLTSCCASAQTTFQPIVPTFELISSSNAYGTGSISITLPSGTSSSEVLAQNSASVMLVTGEAWANQASVEKKGSASLVFEICVPTSAVDPSYLAAGQAAPSQIILPIDWSIAAAGTSYSFIADAFSGSGLATARSGMHPTPAFSLLTEVEVGPGLIWGPGGTDLKKYYGTGAAPSPLPTGDLWISIEEFSDFLILTRNGDKFSVQHEIKVPELSASARGEYDDEGWGSDSMVIAEASSKWRKVFSGSYLILPIAP